MLLVKFEGNYSDEFDCNSFRLMTEAQWANALANFKEEFEHSDNDEVAFGFGSNEDIFYVGMSELLKDFTIREITKLEAETLMELFPNCELYAFGTGIYY